jgi:hypothetical protein
VGHFSVSTPEPGRGGWPDGGETDLAGGFGLIRDMILEEIKILAWARP